MSDINRFSLGGTDDTALGVVLLPDFKEPMLPRSRDRFMEIPGRHGRWNFESDLRARQIVLKLALIDPATAEALQIAARTFTALLLDQDGHPEDVALVFTKEPLKTYTVRYSGNMPIKRLIGASKGIFSLPLVQGDPFVYEAEVTNSAQFTAAYQEESIENAGDYRTPPVLTFTNSGVGNVTGFTFVVRQLKP